MNNAASGLQVLQHILRLSVLTTLLLLAVGAAQASKKNDTLLWLTEFEPPTYDFYAQTNREGVVLAKHIWDEMVKGYYGLGRFVEAIVF